MCGLAGYYTFTEKVSADICMKMTSVLAHRGPDDDGVWIDVENGIALGHRRLSIQDVSPFGHQPMTSKSGRYVVVYNGEIYNFMSLQSRLKLEGYLFRGHSDTEVLLSAIECWGIKRALKEFAGMFAFALWDKKELSLTLARDRIGEKPLYYGWQNNNLLFGSELNALKQHPGFRSQINRDAITLLLRHNYIPAPYSIYKDIFKIEPGSFMTISVDDLKPKVSSYWSASDIAVSGVRQPFTGTPDEAVDELEHLAKDTIRQQMMADVPLGAFLSGGIDSSTVVALMQAQSSASVKTFSIGFHEEGYNEAKYAKAVARHLGTDHTELYVTSEEVMAVIPRLPTLYCEPFSDSSQISTFLVSQLAKQYVTVSLSGDAGDELFCGYNRYQMTDNLWQRLSMLPVSLRTTVAKGITSISPKGWNSMSKFIPGVQRFSNIGDKLHKGADVLASRSIDELYLGLVSHHRDPSALVIGGREPSTLLTDNVPDFDGLSDVQRMMVLDLMTYLPDDILVKVDRAAMGVSLETRVPFLDHRIIEFAWSLPQSIKVRNSQPKWPLRQVLYRYVPRELIDRPKMGFGVPLHDWLRGPLRDWVEALIDESRLHQEGIFEPEPIRKLWSEHLTGKRNWAYLLWDILMFQAWLENENL